MPTRTIKVDHLARVEGEGALSLTIRGGTVTEAHLKIFEPPRFFEGILQGRAASEAPDITARICGICPIAYQMSAVHAIERAAGVSVTGPLRDLRRLIYCGEWIESHGLHVFMLHAPDFLGYPDAVAMARDHRQLVETGLRIKKAGNDIVSLLGGREIHPINVRLGGFYRVPDAAELMPLRETLLRSRDDLAGLIDWAITLPCPDVEHDYEFVALQHPEEYPFNEGRIVSSAGIDIDARDFEEIFEEYQEPRSTALHAVIRGRGAYHVGPMARFNLNRHLLTPLAADAARKAALDNGCRNPFQSLLVRCIEMLFAFEEALRLIDAYEPPDTPFVPVEPRGVTGWAATEAPRGLLYHRYDIDPDGRIAAAKLVPPTSQNQKTIEEDIRLVAQASVTLEDDALRGQCEQAIRNYDPCISCSTHFLKLVIDRQEDPS